MNLTLSNIYSFILHYPDAILAGVLFLIIIYTIYLHQKVRRFTRGESGASLETLIKTCVNSVAEIEKRNELIAKHAVSLDNRVSHAIRNAQTIRYKAFEVNGSNQSFSIALLNEKGSGVVISSLHSRDRVSTFAKPIEKYSSTYELTDEEHSVISEAKIAHKK